jgi:hypothetical protein
MSDDTSRAGGLKLAGEAVSSILLVNEPVANDLGVKDFWTP